MVKYLSSKHEVLSVTCYPQKANIYTQKKISGVLTYHDILVFNALERQK